MQSYVYCDGDSASRKRMEGNMCIAASNMGRISKALRPLVITGLVSALCTTGSASLGDDRTKKSQSQNGSFEEIINSVVKEGKRKLLSTLDVGKGVEMALWDTIFSVAGSTPDEQRHAEKLQQWPSVLLVELVVPMESDVKKKHKFVPMADEASHMVCYDVLEREVRRPIASVYWISVRQAGEPQVPVASFFAFNAAKTTWIRVPGGTLK